MNSVKWIETSLLYSLENQYLKYWFFTGWDLRLLAPIKNTRLSQSKNSPRFPLINTVTLNYYNSLFKLKQL